LNNYYYFAATLPSVNYGDAPSAGSADFREECGNFLSDADMALLRYCRYDAKMAVETVKSTGSDFLDAVMTHERTLVLNLAALRAARLKRPAREEPPHGADDAEVLAKTAFEMDDPLAAELLIDRARWDMLDELKGLDLFGVNVIYAHLMKLQLLERRQLFDAAKGAVEYRKLYDTILNKYNSNEYNASSSDKGL
jgi:hypothetical protein